MAEWWETPIDNSYDTSVPGYSTDGAWLGTPMTDIATQSGSGWTPDNDWWNTPAASGGGSGIGSFLGSLPYDKILGGLGAVGTIGGLLTNNKYPGGGTVSQNTALKPWWEDAAMTGLVAAKNVPGYESKLTTPGTLLRNTDISEYMNPFVEATLNPVLRNMDIEEADEQNRLASQASKVGAFGGSRPMLDQSLALERQGRRRDEAINKSYSDAFNVAQSGALSDIGRTWDDIGMQYKSPFDQVGALRDMISATKTTGDMTQTTTQNKKNPWETVAGAGIGGLGLYNQLYGGNQ